MKTDQPLSSVGNPAELSFRKHLLVSRNEVVAFVGLAALCAVLWFVGAKDYRQLHMVLDTSSCLLSGVLALLLWDMGAKTDRPFLRWLSLSFAFTSLLELVHVLVFVEWGGSLQFIAGTAGNLGPTTWPPAGTILPIGVICSIWLKRRGYTRSSAFAFVLMILSIALMLVYYHVPRYTPSVLFGITRPFLFLTPLVWAIVTWQSWRARFVDRIRTPLIELAVVLTLAHVPMLFSQAPHDTLAMIAHIGKVCGYLVFLFSLTTIASQDMAERLRAERELALRQSSEETLRKSQEHLSLVVEAAPSAMLLVDEHGLITLVNAQAERLFGYERSELLGQLAESLIPDRYRTSHHEHRTTFSQHPSFRAMGAGRELFGRRKDGTEVPIDIGLNPIQTEDGPVVLASIIDISERRRVEQVARESEERFQTVIENLSEGLIISELDGQIIHWNRAGLDMHGFETLDECLLKVPEFQKIFELSTPDGEVLTIDQWPLPRIIAGEHLVDFEVKIRRLDKEWWRIFTYGGSIVKEPNGRQLAFVACDDITNRKRAEAELRRNQEQLSAVIGSAMDAIITVDDEQRIVLFNNSAERMFLFPAEDAIGQPLDRFIPERFRLAHKVHVDEFGQTQVTQRSMGSLGALFGLRADGEEFPIEASISQVESDHRQLYTVILRDVTQRRKSEEALQQALAQLRAKNDELASMTEQLWQASKLATMGELAASVAHELNNPLATVALRIEMLAMALDDEDPNQFPLAVITGEVERMANLVNNLLQFSRRSHRQVSTVEVREEIVSSTELVHYHLRTRKIEVTTEFGELLPTIQADRQQLRQLFLNLLTNATDAMPEGGFLKIRATPTTIKGETAVQIEFSDSGEGIAPEHLEKIWDPFFTTKPEGKGTGLGLAICRRIVEEQGGRIDLESQVGQGTTLRIILVATNGGGSILND